MAQQDKGRTRDVDNIVGGYQPNSFLGKLWRWHINFCPGWKGYFTSQSEEKKAELRAKYNFQKY